MNAHRDTARFSEWWHPRGVFCEVWSMKSIPASVAILGIATLMAATLAVPAAVSAADWIPRAEPSLAVEPMPSESQFV